MDIKSIVCQHQELVRTLRRELHRIREAGFEEEKTSRFVADFLKDTGLEVETGIARHGVVGHLKCAASGKTLLIRADMDGLPVTEETGLAFASTHKGMMHACGHDGHMSMVLVTARILRDLAYRMKGNVKFVFQPAEEGPGGALSMIEEGVMEDPRVDHSLGCHVWPHIPEGSIGIKPGPLMAAMDRFDLIALGRDGHGAMPHLCVDQMEKIIGGVCDSMGASYELNYLKGFPPLINDEAMAARVRRSAEQVVGKDRVVVPEPTMGGEDMACFLERLKGCYFFLGVGQKNGVSLHHERFDFNESDLSLGVETYCRIALDLLGES